MSDQFGQENFERHSGQLAALPRLNRLAYVALMSRARVCLAPLIA